jgi:deoxyribodipyrimidine photo-lyase
MREALVDRETVTLVWLKRDLRIHDHAPLSMASKQCEGGGKALAFYVLEQDYWNSDKASPEQQAFVLECLRDLKTRLGEIGCRLHVFKAPCASGVLSSLVETYDVSTILCHQETGNLWTFERDRAVLAMAKTLGISVKEFHQNGVIRGKGKPKLEGTAWLSWIGAEDLGTPKFWRNPSTPPNFESFDLEKVMTPYEQSTNRQIGGELVATDLLESFVTGRCLDGEGYRKEMGSPLRSSGICSRLSAHLTWGSLSSRLAFRASRKALAQGLPRGAGKEIQSFITRLRWRDHFLQKFERLHWMEWRCINPEAETLHGWNEESYSRWSEGMTGYPFVDACMRSLNATKWINFRARAMLVSFASYALNLDWRRFAPHLARTFLDYEPGIHYSQIQMQAGTTLGSPPRIYNPIKQSLEKDPRGEFIRRWVPELRHLPDKEIHHPALTSRNGYPTAILDPANLWSIMRANGPKSRSPRPAATPRKSQTKTRSLFRRKVDDAQPELFLPDC